MGSDPSVHMVGLGCKQREKCLQEPWYRHGRGDPLHYLLTCVVFFFLCICVSLSPWLDINHYLSILSEDRFRLLSVLLCSLTLACKVCSKEGLFTVLLGMTDWLVRALVLHEMWYCSQSRAQNDEGNGNSLDTCLVQAGSRGHRVWDQCITPSLQWDVGHQGPLSSCTGH
jgi:hypothetical protein